MIDDLGAERSSEYMIEQVLNIVDSRYRAGLPMIITTNLTATELKGAKEISYVPMQNLRKMLPFRNQWDK